MTAGVHARLAKLADAPDLGSGAFGREGSTPLSRTQRAPRNGVCEAGNLWWRTDCRGTVAHARARRCATTVVSVHRPGGIRVFPPCRHRMGLGLAEDPTPVAAEETI